MICTKYRSVTRGFIGSTGVSLASTASTSVKCSALAGWSCVLCVVCCYSPVGFMPGRGRGLGGGADRGKYLCFGSGARAGARGVKEECKNLQEKLRPGFEWKSHKRQET